MKKLSTAIADGDQVYGVVAGSKVYQNIGSSSITVPNADSLANLFEDLIKQVHIDPKRISVVEAHGTGILFKLKGVFGVTNLGRDSCGRSGRVRSYLQNIRRVPAD